MALVQEKKEEKHWADDLSIYEVEELKTRRYLLQRPGNSPINWTAVLAARSDMTPIDGLQNLEIHRTKGIASLGILPDESLDSGASDERAPAPMSDGERAEMEAQHAESHAEEVRKRADNSEKLRELKEATESLKGGIAPPDYGQLSKKQLVAWAKDNLDITIELPMNKPGIIGIIEESIQKQGDRK